MKVLYVENHARFAKLTTAQFLASHEVTVVPSVVAARHALAQSTFDVVLVDYDLDDGKGDEVVKWLQFQSHRPLVIAVSSHQAGNDALVTAGANAVCNKMQFANIENVLTQLLQSDG
jgi:DNA-binding response OmpR family regulator